MKRLPVFIFLCLLFAHNAFAQTKRGYLLSVSAGMTSNTVYGTMVERNKQFGANVKQENRTGFAINVNIEKKLSGILFLRTGLNFMHKQVNPMVNTFSIYQDELKTDYLSIPVEVGVNLIPEEKHIHLALTIGTMTNFSIKDNSKIGPDRIGFRSSVVSESINAGARVSFYASPKNRLFFQYNYLYDITTAYKEFLAWSPAEPNKKFTYYYKTHLISIGMQWSIK